MGFNFNGSLALTGSYDGMVRIWDVQNGSLLQVLEGPDDVEWAQWHSKGNAIIAGSKDGTVWMWLAHNGQCMQVFAGKIPTRKTFDHKYANFLQATMNWCPVVCFPCVENLFAPRVRMGQ